MQPSTTTTWERLVTPARWIAAALGVIAVAWNAYMVIGSASAYTNIDPLLYVQLALVIVGTAVAIFWKGFGEVIGGLALVALGIWSAISSGTGPRPIVSAVVYALAGVLFIACGWYALTRQRSGAAHTMA